MLNQKVLKYVDDVMASVTAPAEIKVMLENELIRHIIEASEHKSIDEVISELGFPRRVANEMSRKSVTIINKENNIVEADKSCKEPPPVRCHERNYPRYAGEYMREESDVNIKLLHIPLIQISSGVERIRVPLNDEYYLD